MCKLMGAYVIGDTLCPGVCATLCYLVGCGLFYFGLIFLYTPSTILEVVPQQQVPALQPAEYVVCTRICKSQSGVVVVPCGGGQQPVVVASNLAESVGDSQGSLRAVYKKYKDATQVQTLHRC